jgi:glycolate oxidase FAD binding subunit
MSGAVVGAEKLRDELLSSPRVVVRGGGTKTGLHADATGAHLVDTKLLSGIVEHLPSEFTITVAAGTPLSEVGTVLGREGQYLPFDPLQVEAGGTVGGAVASGLAGSGRHRYGGVRDFILAVQILDGRGRFVRGGRRVVKNAAGFDLPKLVVGSLGSIGILTEVTFKVFPRAAATATVSAELQDLEQAVQALGRLRRASVELDAVDFDWRGRLWVRVAGRALEQRVPRVVDLIGAGRMLADNEAGLHWEQRRELLAPEGTTLLKVPVTPRRIVGLDAAMNHLARERYYSSGGQEAWLSLESSAELAALDEVLTRLDLRGLVVLGGVGGPLLGARRDEELQRRVRRAFDPESRFVTPLGSD